MDGRTREQVELEVVSSEARLRLTRLLRASVKSVSESDDSHQIELIRMNRIVNLANTVLGRPIYALELSDWDYFPAEYAWHFAEFELVMRRPDTAQLVEILADLVDQTGLSRSDVNAILESDNVGLRLGSDEDGVTVRLQDLSDVPEAGLEPDAHPNVRGLVERMDRALQDKDWSLVLHTGASIFETVAKEVVPNPNVQQKSLGSWFSAYRNHSHLAAPMLDAAEAIFQRRNVEPLAGHGSVEIPGVTEAEAIQIRELSIAFVRMERLLARAEPSKTLGAGKSRSAPAVALSPKKVKSSRKLRKPKALT
jgi:hypothetical protein